MNSNLICNLYNFQQQNPEVYIGGSISLILQNVIPLREIKDIDLICINKFSLKQRIFYQEGFKYEMFYNPKAEYIEYQFEDKIIKISPVQEVIDWKIKFKNKYLNSDKAKKHLIDIENLKKLI